MKTIPRNATKQIAALREKLTVCHVYALYNNFIAKGVDPSHAWKELESPSRAKLYANDNGTYTVQVHSNLWYELRAS